MLWSTGQLRHHLCHPNRFILSTSGSTGHSTIVCYYADGSLEKMASRCLGNHTFSCVYYPTSQNKCHMYAKMVRCEHISCCLLTLRMSLDIFGANMPLPFAQPDRLTFFFSSSGRYGPFCSPIHSHDVTPPSQHRICMPCSWKCLCGKHTIGEGERYGVIESKANLTVELVWFG